MNILAFISWLIPMIAIADDLAYAAIAAAIIGGLTTAGVGVANSISAKKARKAAERTIGGLNAENATNYYADYYRGALQNDATRAYLKRLDASMKKNNQALDNSIVSSGATHENALAQRQGRNAVVSDTMANIVAAEDNHRDRVRNNYFANKRAFEQMEMNSRQNHSAQKQQNRATIAAGIGQTASALASLYGGGSSAAAGSGTSAATSSYAPVQQGLADLSSQNLSNQYAALAANSRNYKSPYFAKSFYEGK